MSDVNNVNEFTFSWTETNDMYETVDSVTKVFRADDDSITWMDVTDQFFYFLRGCGYVIDKDDFDAYLKDRGGDTASAENEYADE